MSDDQLAKWRRPGSEPVPMKDAPATIKPYQPFGEGSAPPRLWLKTAPKEPEQGLPYGYLTNVNTDTWGYIGLTYSIPFPGPVVVQIFGECLEPLIEAIMRGSAAWIQQFEATWFKAPQDGTPVVKEIVVHSKPPETVTKH